MRVIYFIDSLARAGAEQSLVSLAPHYANRGVSLEVAYLHERPGLRDELEAAGGMAISLAGVGGRLGWIQRARRLVLERRPDLIHTTLFEADIAGRVAGWLTRVPIVSSLVNVSYGPEQLTAPQLAPWKVRCAQLLDAGTARQVARFHAVSGHIAEVMALRLRIPPGKIDVVPRGRDPRRLGTRAVDRRARARASIGVGVDTPLILAVARQEQQKGLDVLLEAVPRVLRHITSARVMIAGREGSQTPVLRSLVAQLGLRNSVTFLGARSDVPELLCGADAFVLPSRWEGMPGALLEAMALEVPIVASDLPTVREAVGDGEIARLVSPGDPHALASAIVATLADPAGSRAMARRARARFLDQFTIERVADQMVEFYERALGVSSIAV